MRSGQYKKTLNKKTIIILAMILSISLIGVGYAKWNNEASVKTEVKTGNIKSTFLIEKDKLDYKDGLLNLYLSNNGDILYIEGEVYSSFNQDIPIEIIDEGSVPSIFKELVGEDGGVSTLEADTKASNNEKQTFILNIKANEDEGYSNFNEDISSLEKQIESLKEEIRLYKNERNYKFEYILSFDQNL